MSLTCSIYVVDRFILVHHGSTTRVARHSFFTRGPLPKSFIALLGGIDGAQDSCRQVEKPQRHHHPKASQRPTGVGRPVRPVSTRRGSKARDRKGAWPNEWLNVIRPHAIRNLETDESTCYLMLLYLYTPSLGVFSGVVTACHRMSLQFTLCAVRLRMPHVSKYGRPKNPGPGAACAHLSLLEDQSQTKADGTCGASPLNGPAHVLVMKSKTRPGVAIDEAIEERQKDANHQVIA